MKPMAIEVSMFSFCWKLKGTCNTWNVLKNVGFKRCLQRRNLFVLEALQKDDNASMIMMMLSSKILGFMFIITKLRIELYWICFAFISETIMIVIYYILQKMEESVGWSNSQLFENGSRTQSNPVIPGDLQWTFTWYIHLRLALFH